MHGNTVYFGDYVFDTERRLLLRNGSNVKATARQMDLLQALLRAEGKIISKTGLMNDVWKDVCVEEHTLLQTIFTLRRTLGKLENGDEYIETVPRMGYRISEEAYRCISAMSVAHPPKKPSQRTSPQQHEQPAVRSWWTRVSLWWNPGGLSRVS